MSAFTQVKSLRPGRSVFDLSYEKKFDFDFGQLIPVCCEEMVPGDTFKFGNEIVINFQPLLAPVLHEINVYVHYFFVPTRLIFDGWEDFITRGIDGNNATLLPRLQISSSIPRDVQCGPYSPYDYFGFPLMKDDSNQFFVPGSGDPLQPSYFFRPLAFPWRCMNLVWNEYYRDETLQIERDLDDLSLCYRNWSKDYFTSALPWQQRGTAPALPISGNLDVLFENGGIGLYSADSISSEVISNDGVNQFVYTGQRDPEAANNGLFTRVSDLNGKASVDLSDALTFDVSDLRLAFQLQKFMERAARGGVRYTEFLTSFFGVAPSDARLQRPEYLGGSKSPIMVSQVTSSAETSEAPLAKLAGKGLTADKNYIGKYTASEFGYLCGYMSAMPKPSYQQGVDRKWLRATFADFYFPQFAHLSEQPVTEEQIYAQPGSSTTSGIGNDTIFGYQAAYNEMRMNQNMVCGSLRDTLNYWHLGRIFDTPPSLNSDFITMNPERDDMKRIFAVQNVPGMICNFANIITGIRPLPKYGEPGLIDHS